MATTDAGNYAATSTPTTARSSNAALREAQDALFQRDGVVASKVEALVEIANRSLDTIADTARRDRYRVHVHLDVDNTMLDGLGYRLPAWLRDLICCDTIMSTVNEVGGIPVSVGRAQRTVPERTRRLVILRDRGCRVPGCTADQFLHVHHVIHWDPDDGDGPTDTWNFALFYVSEDWFDGLTSLACRDRRWRVRQAWRPCSCVQRSARWLPRGCGRASR